MHEDLARLERLDTLDRGVASRKTEIEKLAVRLTEARNAAKHAAAALEEAETKVSDNDAAQKANVRKTREFQQRMASAIKIMEMGAGDPDAAERQRTKCAALIDEAETEMLELMEAADEAEASRVAAQTAQAEAEATRVTAESEVPDHTQRLEAEIQDLLAKRPGLLAELPSDHRGRYEAFRARNKWAVARIERNACTACRMEVRPQHLTDLRKGRMEPCRGCHRWLIPDKELV
ncbi:MAG: hypothetical protein AAGA48_12525 [Myxococcota bacterium]